MSLNANANDPYALLGVASDADDETIRKRYLELVREFPPERAPERFAAIRRAYEQLKDAETRLKKRLFHIDTTLTLETLIEEQLCTSSRSRVPLARLVEMAQSR